MRVTPTDTCTPTPVRLLPSERLPSQRAELTRGTDRRRSTVVENESNILLRRVRESLPSMILQLTTHFRVRFCSCLSLGLCIFAFHGSPRRFSNQPILTTLDHHACSFHGIFSIQNTTSYALERNRTFGR
ncbi:hypothetical protein P692DRAFT_20931593 [Suillus brevipes Sb2]|nr:hypothetical protein P692DRAFT_20931593 [Suillus brevipes Sb2]